MLPGLYKLFQTPGYLKRPGELDDYQMSLSACFSDPRGAVIISLIYSLFHRATLSHSRIQPF